MSLKSKIQWLGAIVATVVSVASLHAVTITFDTGGTNSGGNNNTRTFTSGSLSVSVTAWSRLNPTSSNPTTANTFTQSYVGQYSGYGLGVTNDNRSDEGSPNHAVDNVSGYDFLLFTFNQLVDINSIKLGWIYNDSDFRLYIGTNVTIPSGLTSGFPYYEDNSSNVSSGTRTATVNSGNLYGNYILIGAMPSQNDADDYFKVLNMDVTVKPPSNVPDSGSTIALLGVGFLGLMGLRRRLQR